MKPQQNFKNSKQKFHSGQFQDGLFEFDTSESFIAWGVSPETPPGGYPIGVHLEVRGRRYRLVEKLLLGRKLVLRCDLLDSPLGLYVEYLGVDMEQGIYPVEALCKFPQNEYLIKRRGKLVWVKAVDTLGLFSKLPEEHEVLG